MRARVLPAVAVLLVTACAAGPQDPAARTERAAELLVTELGTDNVQQVSLTDTLLTLHYAGFRIREVPVTMRERLSGQSMHSTLKGFYYVAKMFLSVFIVWLRWRTHSQALRPGKENA